MDNKSTERKKITPQYFRDKKNKGEKITMLTAYDFPTASALDNAGIDSILVGDSLGNVILGYESTVPVTMEEMIHHCKAVKRGVKYAFIIADMPFLSYHVSVEDAKYNAGRLIKETGCDAVKLEGGLNMTETVKSIVDMGIPVVAHIGLTPQTAVSLGGMKAQGKDIESAQYQLDSALALEKAGACMIVFECIPSKLAAVITKKLNIPTIGIGAGADCDGQVLVVNDMLGLNPKPPAKMVKQYASLFPVIQNTVQSYMKEVTGGKFPTQEHTYKIDDDILAKLKI